jgi:uncharacterized protein (TIGR02996 family)
MSRWEQNLIAEDVAGFRLPDPAEWGAFVRAICADPESDAVRLIAADWLDEQGFAGRAELIRLQIAGLPSDRESELLAAVEAYWHHWPCAIVATRYRRGFVEEVTLTASRWSKHASALLAEHPIREVTLTTWPDTGDLARALPAAVFNQIIDQHSASGPSHSAWAEYCRRLLSATWPGIKFTLPTPRYLRGDEEFIPEPTGQILGI